MSIKSQCINCNHYTSADFCAIKGVNLSYDGAHCQERVRRSSNVNVNTQSITNSGRNNSTSVEKQRHGCVTAWLVLVVVVNSFAAIIYFFASELIAWVMPNVSKTMNVLSGILCVAYVIFAVMLFQWKKIGFLGLIVSCIVASIINIYIGFGVVESVLGLGSIAILYGILQIKKDNVTTWENLE